MVDVPRQQNLFLLPACLHCRNVGILATSDSNQKRVMGETNLAGSPEQCELASS